MHTLSVTNASGTALRSRRDFGNAIDFGGMELAISVQKWGTFRGLSLRHPAPQLWAVITDTYLVSSAFAALPSLNIKAAPKHYGERVCCV